jgi:hypothetical protein
MRMVPLPFRDDDGIDQTFALQQPAATAGFLLSPNSDISTLNVI